MLTISKPLSSGHAQSYHKLEFTSETQNYYKQGDAVRGEWQGQLAFHPFTVSAHYCLWRRQDRSRYVAEDKHHGYATREELVLATASLVFAILAGVYIGLY
jgi:hypothetical protein